MAFYDSLSIEAVDQRMRGDSLAQLLVVRYPAVLDVAAEGCLVGANTPNLHTYTSYRPP